MTQARIPGTRRIASCLFVLSLAVTPALAASFDCGKARDSIEKLICDTPEVSERDKALARRYTDIRAMISFESGAVLRDTQRVWLTGRAVCVQDQTAPQAQAAACLNGLYKDREADLKARFRRVNGLVLESRRTSRAFPRIRVTESDEYPWLIGVPAPRAAAFDIYLRRRLDPGKSLLAASGIKPEPNRTGEMEFRRSHEIHRFDTRLISIQVFQTRAGPDGRGWRSEHALNWDLTHDRPLRLVDLFAPGKDWRGAVRAHVTRWLRKEGLEERFGDMSEVEDDDSWLFNDNEALLLLGRGERSVAGPSSEAPVPYDLLAPLLRPDSALTLPAAP